MAYSERIKSFELIRLLRERIQRQIGCAQKKAREDPRHGSRACSAAAGEGERQNTADKERG